MIDLTCVTIHSKDGRVSLTNVSSSMLLGTFFVQVSLQFELLVWCCGMLLGLLYLGCFWWSWFKEQWRSSLWQEMLGAARGSHKIKNSVSDATVGAVGVMVDSACGNRY